MPAERSPRPCYEIHITQTRKTYRPDDEYRAFDEYDLVETSIEEVRALLTELYGDCKREPMFLDDDGGARQVGWVYCFNNEWADGGVVRKFRQQDWVQVVEVLGSVIDPKVWGRRCSRGDDAT